MNAIPAPSSFSDEAPQRVFNCVLYNGEIDPELFKNRSYGRQIG